MNCKLCGAKLPIVKHRYGGNRPREYCNAAHKQKYFRHQHRQEQTHEALRDDGSPNAGKYHQDARRYYVYTLAYPELMGGHVFYVGWGTGTRIDDHEVEARGYCGTNPPQKINTIKEIWSAGEQVVKKKVALFEMRGDAVLHERDLIAQLKPHGHLTNIKSGDVWIGWELSRTKEQMQEAEDEWEEMLHRRTESTKRYYAQQRQQALQRMRYPIISPTDAEWKQGVTALSLWEVAS